MEDLQEMLLERQSRPIHPGEVLVDILEDLDITQTAFAKAIGVSRRTVNELIQGRRSLTVDMAIRIGKALGNGPRLWMNLQQKVDLWDALQAHREEYEKVSVID
ncbi:HigA family addiction module antitoxin [Vacuolonema iberomarrocanum]|uniref:HigA family addiction module antitoxin n=1 Tax=Vacuolonema iberomarrocanum TaxID=3454632 RepID=UPI0019ED9E63|nr:HigA family addiction module antidote protein [filamentous cyanobacterium LEGE 07170]